MATRAKKGAHVKTSAAPPTKTSSSGGQAAALSRDFARLVAQQDRLSKKIEMQRKKELPGVIKRIKEAIAHYGLTAADLGLATEQLVVIAPVDPFGKRKGGQKVKYANKAGNTWSGRGPRPRWVREALQAGKKLEDFRV